jgi:hypothetical protein
MTVEKEKKKRKTMWMKHQLDVNTASPLNNSFILTTAPL